MSTQIKATTLDRRSLKAGPDDSLGEGVFQAYASVFDNVDSYGDIVRKGAFARNLKEWEEKSAALPLLWGHDMYDPFSNLGDVKEAREDDHGLWIEAQLDLENPKAMQVYRMLKGRRVDQMSFAYDTIGSKSATLNGRDVRELLDLDVYEVSVVPLGANAETEVLLVKAAAAMRRVDEVKAGRVLSAKNESALRAAYDSIGAVLDALEPDDPKASEPGPAKDEEPPAAKSEEPSQSSSVLARLQLELALSEIDSL